MKAPSIIIPEGIITSTHRFRSRNGNGIDYYVEVTDNSTVFFQVVFYDDRADRYSSIIKIGDSVRITGTLSVRTYTKKDGSTGTSLVIEEPSEFSIIQRGNTEVQQLDYTEEDLFADD